MSIILAFLVAVLFNVPFVALMIWDERRYERRQMDRITRALAAYRLSRERAGEYGP